ncbi:NFX1-type zinc finger-containing protein 1 [Durusdinium trenchii]|uniref:NFX1-type zinc finger-containing protein 1 n=1 Tax=Durusdinium trenchii TaxID=1381693 RepID=A0ABP0QUR4_9DINO
MAAQLRQLREQGTELDVFHYGCALRQLRWTEALHLLQEMDGTKVRSNQVIFNSGIDLTGKGFQWQVATELFQMMPTRVLKTDAIGRGAWVSGLRRSGLRTSWLGALQAALGVAEVEGGLELQTFQRRAVDLSHVVPWQMLDGDDQVETDDADPVAGPRDPGEVGIALEVETPRPKMTKALSELWIEARFRRALSPRDG